MISPKQSEKQKSMTTTDKYSVEGYFNLRTSSHNIMHSFFYSNISELSENSRND